MKLMTDIVFRGYIRFFLKKDKKYIMLYNIILTKLLNYI